VCVADLCPALTLSANVAPSATNRTVGAVITLSCASGYSFTDGSAAKYVTCKNLQWVGDTTATCYGEHFDHTLHELADGNCR
jgi:hypothetical protein